MVSTTLPRRATSAFVVAATAAALMVLVPSTARATVARTDVFINEIHYDNAGADSGEGFEVAGPAGTDLSSWSVALYNGNGGARYSTVALSGTIPDLGGGFGVLAFSHSGIQNGAPDGLALIDDTGAVAQFLSYEGSFTASGGPADGLTSTDIGVSEPGSTPVGDSLQLTGSGTGYGDFSWAAPQPNTFGAVNTGQSFTGGGGGPADPLVNEFVANHTGADTAAFTEILGTPATDYSAFTLLEIEGDSGGAGTIDYAGTVGTTDGAGFFVDGEDMENGTITILLVEGFTGSVGDDIDIDNDGTIDVTPWSRIVDGVGVHDGGASDRNYVETVLTRGYDGSSFTVGGASRIPNGTDTDTAADWVRNDFFGWGLPGFVGDPDVGEAVNTPDAPNEVVTVPTDPFGSCGVPTTLIHDIQGSGSSSPDVGSIRTIEGVVVGDFDGPDQLGGFFLQEEDADADADPATSEGIFVFEGSFGTNVSVGDTVRVRGSVTEFFDLTELNDLTDLTICASGSTLPTAAAPTLPVSSIGEWERWEGMAVTFGQTLYVSGNFNQGRFGEVDLSVGGPLDNPTNVVEPGAAAVALQDLNDRSRIQLEDGSTRQNPVPPPYFVFDGTLRTGDSVDGLTGVLSYSFGNYEVHPTATVAFDQTNPRPGVPDVGSDLTVASFNVLNYFTTIDTGAPICGPNGDQGCRGADSADELARQKAKIVAAIGGLDADVVGLMEIENHPGDVPTADLVDGLNGALGAGTYDYVATGAIGDDAIRVALIYQPASVMPVGAFAVLDSSVDARFNDDKNRPALAQTFVDTSTGGRFTVVVNHLKSKGSPCDALGDPDVGDGQGNCNLTRTAAAEALADWTASDPTHSNDPDVLIIGDLNSYAMEDPIDALKAGGYTDLIAEFVGSGWEDGAYSFNFFSQSGYLDHGLANASMAEQVTGAAFWHVNADEPRALDYNDFNQAALYHPDAFRSSDHDPVVIGIDTSPRGLKVQATMMLEALLPPGFDDDGEDDDHHGRFAHEREDEDKDLKRIAKAIERIDDSLDPEYWVDAYTLDDHEGKKVFDRERQAVKELRKVDADLQGIIDLLVNADRRLASDAVDAAIARGGDERRIRKAIRELEKAERYVGAGRDDKAIKHFKKAWKEATKA